jgi:hypothetical protein
MSGVLQRAAVRDVGEKEEEATEDVEPGRLRESRFRHDFSQVGMDRGGLPKEVSETPNKTGLPDNLKAGVENISGYSLDDIRVHYNSPKPAQLQALAYTQGTEIHVAPGQESHVPHEAWHVVQQMQRRVKQTNQMKGVMINDEEGLEKEADVMGEKATRAAPQPSNMMIMKEEGIEGRSPVQRKERTAEVAWAITHVVYEKGGSLYGNDSWEENEGEELINGTELVVDDELVMLSRRGANQEEPEKRELDKKWSKWQKWVQVKQVNKEEINTQRGEPYVREETIKYINEEGIRARKNVSATRVNSFFKSSGEAIEGLEELKEAWGKRERRRKMSTDPWNEGEQLRWDNKGEHPEIDENRGELPADTGPHWDQIKEGVDVSEEILDKENHKNIYLEGEAEAAVLEGEAEAAVSYQQFFYKAHVEGEENQKAIGVMTVEERKGQDVDEGVEEAKVLYIRWLAGNPEYGGVGIALVKEAIKVLQDGEVGTMYVNSAPSAVQWYIKMGFSLVDEMGSPDSNSKKWGYYSPLMKIEKS